MKKPYYIFLDDIRYPRDVNWIEVPIKPWIIMRDYNNFVQYITDKGYAPSFICYDHDLGESHYGHGLNNDKIPYDTYNEKTGYDCAKWMVEFCQNKKIKHPAYVVHSMNPVGKQNIQFYVESYNKTII